MKKTNYSRADVVHFSYRPAWWLSMPRPGRLFTVADYGIALIAGLAGLWLYLQTLGPTITGEDSGEFVAAAYTLGIPHPPGYPLYCMVGHLFTWLPWGEVAWRVNLMSACFGAGAVSMAALLVVYLTRNRFAALVAALALACSREFWAQSLVADVYSMTAFFFALCLLLLMMWKDTRNKNFLYVFAFLFGLAVTVHYTFTLLMPVFASYVFFANFVPPETTSRSNRLRWKDYVVFSLVATAGLLPFAYLPIRSLANPPVDWGNPETLSNFFDVLRRNQFAFMYDQYPRSWERFVEQAAVYGRFWLGEFQVWGTLAGLGGLLILLRRHFWHGLLLILSGLVVVVGFIHWQNFEQTREWFWVMRVFGLPAYLVTAVGIGMGVEVIWKRTTAWRVTAVLLGLMLLSASLHANWQRNDKSAYYWTYDYGRNILETLPADAVYVSESDHGSFGVLYLQHVLGLRPDVTNLRRYGYFSGPLIEQLPAALKEEAGEFPRQSYEGEILSWILKNTGRPLYLGKPMPLPDAPGARIVPAGLLFRVLRSGEADSEGDYWQEYRWHTLAKEDTQGDYTADAILHEIAIAKAQTLLIEAREVDAETSSQKKQEALRYIEEGLAAYGRDPVMLNNAGVLCARYGLYEAARDYFREALQQLPTLPTAKQNLERAEKRLASIMPSIAEVGAL